MGSVTPWAVSVSATASGWIDVGGCVLVLATLIPVLVGREVGGTQNVGKTHARLRVVGVVRCFEG